MHKHIFNPSIYYLKIKCNTSTVKYENVVNVMF